MNRRKQLQILARGLDVLTASIARELVTESVYYGHKERLEFLEFRRKIEKGHKLSPRQLRRYRELLQEYEKGRANLARQLKKLQNPLVMRKG